MKNSSNKCYRSIFVFTPYIGFFAKYSVPCFTTKVSTCITKMASSISIEVAHQLFTDMAADKARTAEHEYFLQHARDSAENPARRQARGLSPGRFSRPPGPAAALAYSTPAAAAGTVATCVSPRFRASVPACLCLLARVLPCPGRAPQLCADPVALPPCPPVCP